MKVILMKDVKNLGRAGEVVSVKDGFARNYLFPRRLAEMATDGRAAYWKHLEAVLKARKIKAEAQRQELAKKLSGKAFTFFMVTAPDSDKIFGTIKPHDISRKLEEEGFEVDRRDIEIPSPIQTLGTFKALIKLGEKAQAEIQIVVERKT